jgi:RNA polymerase sigma-70 factor (sigma-E family)
VRRDQERDSGADELERLLAERGNWLMGIAIALTGKRADAEDLLQAALERLLRNQRGVIDTEAYLRRTLYNLAADGWRRRGAWRRKLRLLKAENTGAGALATPDDTATVDLRDELVRLLLRLPPHQRAVIMLRYWEQLSEAEAAEVLGCSTGAVKSAASKGLRRLRELAGSPPDAQAASGQDGAPPPAPAREKRSGLRQRAGITSGRELFDLAKERS